MPMTLIPVAQTSSCSEGWCVSQASITNKSRFWACVLNWTWNVPPPLSAMPFFFFFKVLEHERGQPWGSTFVGHRCSKILAEIMDTSNLVSRCILHSIPSVWTITYIWSFLFMGMFSTCSVRMSWSSCMREVWCGLAPPSESQAGLEQQARATWPNLPQTQQVGSWKWQVHLAWLSPQFPQGWCVVSDILSSFVVARLLGQCPLCCIWCTLS